MHNEGFSTFLTLSFVLGFRRGKGLDRDNARQRAFPFSARQRGFPVLFLSPGKSSFPAVCEHPSQRSPTSPAARSSSTASPRSGAPSLRRPHPDAREHLAGAVPDPCGPGASRRSRPPSLRPGSTAPAPPPLPAAREHFAAPVAPRHFYFFFKKNSTSAVPTAAVPRRGSSVLLLSSVACSFRRRSICCSVAAGKRRLGVAVGSWFPNTQPLFL